MKKTCEFILIGLMSQTLVNAQTGIVDDAIVKLQEGDSTELRMDLYTNNVTANAVAFLKNSKKIKDESKRLEVVLFSVSLMSQSVKYSDCPDDQGMESFVDQMVKLLKEDSREMVRREIARGLMSTASTNVLNRHHVDIRQAANEKKEIPTLQLYASLPACDESWLLEVIGKIKPENEMQQHRLDSIMSRYGNQAATDRLINGTSNLINTCFNVLNEYINLLVFTRSEQVQKFLASDLRSETVMEIAGGDKIPWRNCCAYILVQMNRSERNFPIKKLTFEYSDEDLIKIEQWCSKNLKISFPTKRKSLIYKPHAEIFPLREKEVNTGKRPAHPRAGVKEMER